MEETLESDSEIGPGHELVHAQDGLVQEVPKTLWVRKSRPAILDSMRAILNSCRLDTMKRVCDNDNVIDGMVIAFRICYNREQRDVQLMNSWIEPLYQLDLFINRLVPSKYRMDFRTIKRPGSK